MSGADPLNRSAMSDTSPAGSGDLAAEFVAVGRIGKAHGVRGDVFVEPWTDAVDERFAIGAVLRTESGTPPALTIESVRDHSGKLVVRFTGIDDRNAAEQIRGIVLVFPASARPPLDDPDEFYDTDLIGLTVRMVSGDDFGSVTDVLHSPGGSVLAIDVSGREVLLPFRREFVPDVDVAGGWLAIDPPDGLLDL
jgi:16S rRNA processing protein RimM